jgi:hypothetical protein
VSNADRHIDHSLTEDEFRYLRKQVRMMLEIRKSPVPRNTNGVVIPKERAQELHALADSFVRE